MKDRFTGGFASILPIMGLLAVIAAFILPARALDAPKPSSKKCPVSMEDFNPYGVENEIRPGVYVLSGNGVQKLMVVTQPLCLDCLDGMAFVMPLEKLIPSDLEEALKKAKERLKEDMAK